MSGGTPNLQKSPGKSETLETLDSLTRHDFFAKGVLLIEETLVKVGPLGFEAAS
jgi:hypothetical protein